MKNLRDEHLSSDGKTMTIKYIYDDKIYHKLLLVDEENDIWRFVPAESWMTLRFVYDNINGKKIYKGVDTDGLGYMILVGEAVCGKVVEEISYDKWIDGKYYAFIQFEKRKYLWQTCQDEDVNLAFKKLHHEIVNKIIKFCKDWNVNAEDAYLEIDNIQGSVEKGEWEACTDSSFELFEHSLSVKDIETGSVDPYLCSI